MNLRKLVATLCIVFSMFFILGSHAYAVTSHSRLSGQDRYGTSTAISKDGWKTTSEYAVIAYGEDFPDALCAAPLAKKYNAPILLVSKDSLDSKFAGASDIRVSNELKRLQVKKVFVVGGTGVVSESVVNEIKAVQNNGAGIEVERISGQDRFQTALEVAKIVGADKGVVVTTGNDFPDALSISPIAAAKGMPIILVDKNSMNQDVAAYLGAKNYLVKTDANQNAQKAYLIGGTGVVGQDIEKQFANKERLSGMDAYETNISVLNKFASDLDYSTAFIATRDNFPDALSGSALASIKISPIILTGDVPASATSKFVGSKFDSITNIQVLGGEGAVKAQALQKLVLDTIELKDLLKASENTMNAISIESKAELAAKVNVTGVPQEAQEQLNSILPMLNSAKLTINTKSTSNDDKSSVKASTDIKIDSTLFPFELKFWIDGDMSKETPKFKEIVKLNPFLAATFPEEFAGKEYMVINSEDILNTGGSGELSGQTPADYKQIAEINKEFQSQLTKLIEKYMAESNSYDLVAYKGEKSVTTPEGTKNAKVYEVALNDDVLKQFLALASDDSKDLDAIKDLNIMGSKGIVLTYYVADNLIIAENAVIDLHIDLAKIDYFLGAAGQGTEPAEKVEGIIDVELNINSQNFNINKTVNVDIPEFNAANSFNFKDMQTIE